MPVEWSTVVNTAVVGLIGLAGGSVIPLLIQRRDRRNAKRDEVEAALREFYLTTDLLVIHMMELVWLHRAYSDEKRDMIDDLDKEWVQGRARRIDEVRRQLDEVRRNVREARIQVQIHGDALVREAADSVDQASSKLLNEFQSTHFVNEGTNQALKDALKTYLSAVRDQVAKKGRGRSPSGHSGPLGGDA